MLILLGLRSLVSPKRLALPITAFLVIPSPNFSAISLAGIFLPHSFANFFTFASVQFIAIILSCHKFSY